MSEMQESIAAEIVEIGLPMLIAAGCAIFPALGTISCRMAAGTAVEDRPPCLARIRTVRR